MKMWLFRSYALPTAAEINRAVDELAELLSRGFTLNECADRMEVGRGTVCVLLSRLCAMYGEVASA